MDRLTIGEFRSSPRSPWLLCLIISAAGITLVRFFALPMHSGSKPIYLCGITATPPHREINKTALGATESVAGNISPKRTWLLKHCLRKDTILVGVEQTTESTPLHLFNPDKTKRYALAFGNEVSGLGETFFPLFHNCIEIPQYGTKHSLNISVAAGIVAWDFFIKLENFF